MMFCIILYNGPKCYAVVNHHVRRSHTLILKYMLWLSLETATRRRRRRPQLGHDQTVQGKGSSDAWNVELHHVCLLG